MPVLMNDVAVKAGVSVTTVSHVLNGTRAVADATRTRVMDAIRELKYYTNASARLLARGRSDSLGLIVSDIENPFFPELIKSFERACLEEDLEVILCTTNYDSRQANSAIRRMIEAKVQGVAVMTSQLEDEHIAELAANDTPVVLLGSPVIGRGRGSVRIDYSRGAGQAIAHLRDFGHRDVAIVTGPANRWSAVGYAQHLKEAMRVSGLPEGRLVEGDNSPEGGGAAVKELLSSGAPTAIVCGNDLMALGAMGALFEAGLRVPEDVSIVGSDDIAFARFSHPPLSTVRIPRDDLGRAAFTALCRMRGKRRTGVETLVESQFVARQSTGPARDR